MYQKKKLNPVIIVLAVILICINLVALLSFAGRIFQNGGEETVNQLVLRYQYAINDGDVDAFMRLLPRSERVSEEKEYVKKNIEEYSGNNYLFELEDTIHKDYDAAGKDTVMLFIIDPMFSPLVFDSYELKLKVTDENENTYHTKMNVCKIGKKYYISDIFMY